MKNKQIKQLWHKQKFFIFLKCSLITVHIMGNVLGAGYRYILINNTQIHLKNQK